MNAPVDYLHPQLPSGLARVAMPVVDATAQSLVGYGRLVDDPAECEIEIVRWPARGPRPVDPDTGDQGGTTEGVFVSEWRGDILYGRNEAVNGHYILAYAKAPELARSDHDEPPRCMLLWHANYHPDGGQMFFRSNVGRSTFRSRFPATTSAPNVSSAFASAARKASTSTPTSGTKAYSA